MSVSARSARREFLANVPSTSHGVVSDRNTVAASSVRGPAERLNADLLSSIFRHIVAASPIKDTLRLKAIHPLAERAVRSALTRHGHVRVAVMEPLRFKIVGMQKVELDTPAPNILIQGSRVESLEEALELLAFLLRSMSCVSRLSLVIEDPESEIAAKLIEALIASEIVRLEVLHLARREGGKPIEAISGLIRANEETLRIVGRVGICEAAASFGEKLRLDRLSLMTFDLASDATTANILEKLAAIQRSGALFKHLSYTSFGGFDPTDERILQFLDECGVTSLRLTMMRGPSVPPKPDYMIGKVRKITHLELGEVVDKPNIVNRLVTHEKLYKKVFPHVEHITFFQRW